jgi:hypothetical protein
MMPDEHLAGMSEKKLVVLSADLLEFETVGLTEYGAILDGWLVGWNRQGLQIWEYSWLLRWLNTRLLTWLSRLLGHLKV